MTTGNALPWFCWIGSTLCPAQSLGIRLNDYADLSGQEIERMTEVAGRVLGHAGITVNWMHCRGAAAPADAEALCSTVLRPHDIVMRVQPREPVRWDTGIHTLGDSIVMANGGQYSTVFVPAVRAQAKSFGVAFDLLMGYALAHEVGHCLLGPGHSVDGLMKAQWNPKDAEGMTRFGLGLSKADAKRVIARLTGGVRMAKGPGGAR